MAEPSNPRDLVDNWIDPLLTDAGFGERFVSPLRRRGNELEEAVTIYHVGEETWTITVQKSRHSGTS